MKFTDEQVKSLSAPLDKKHVKTRQQAKQSLSYVEGWHVIAEANRIFGFGEWIRQTLEMKCVHEGERPDGKASVTYMARVRIAVGTGDDQIFRDGTGTGQGIAKNAGDAHESAMKEAETDAMKRALMTFGNPFGLALYDKSQASVVDTPPPPKLTAAERMIANRPAGKRYDSASDSKLALQGHMTAMALATTQAELKDFCATNKREIDHLLDADWADLAIAIKKRMTELPEGVAQDNAA